jgi:hypothetical protein
MLWSELPAFKTLPAAPGRLPSEAPEFFFVGALLAAPASTQPATALSSGLAGPLLQAVIPFTLTKGARPPSGRRGICCLFQWVAPPDSTTEVNVYLLPVLPNLGNYGVNYLCAPAQTPEARHNLAQPVRAGKNNQENPAP